jgi:hypothetical protein
MDDFVIKAAQVASAAGLQGTDKTVSQFTKNAQAIAKAWRKAVHELDPDRFLIEALVDPELDQKIDILDRETHCAYEFKVSGKNATSEFYKDVVKVIVWNERHKTKIGRLVFITEEYGRRFLGAPMPQAYIRYLDDHGLRVSIAYVTAETGAGDHLGDVACRLPELCHASQMTESPFDGFLLDTHVKRPNVNAPGGIGPNLRLVVVARSDVDALRIGQHLGFPNCSIVDRGPHVLEIAKSLQVHENDARLVD